MLQAVSRGGGGGVGDGSDLAVGAAHCKWCRMVAVTTNSQTSQDQS